MSRSLFLNMCVFPLFISLSLCLSVSLSLSLHLSFLKTFVALSLFTKTLVANRYDISSTTNYPSKIIDNCPVYRSVELSPINILLNIQPTLSWIVPARFFSTKFFKKFTFKNVFERYVLLSVGRSLFPLVLSSTKKLGDTLHGWLRVCVCERERDRERECVCVCV